MNPFPHLFLAATSLLPSGSVPGGRTASEAIRGALPVLAAVLLLGGMLLAWAKYFRKKRSDRSRETPAWQQTTEEDSDDAQPHSGRRRRRRRRHRRDHRPRNPTLAETGGLPPERPEGSTGSVP